MGLFTDIYKKKIVTRYDENGVIKYFSKDDYPALNAEPYFFKSGDNTLKGYFYSYDNPKEGKLVVFCHGLFGGHRSYMVEIETLCRHGYTVFAYDTTGCFESEGKSIIGVSQFLADLDWAIKDLKKNEIFKKYKNVYAIGHSSGSYAVLNILNYHDDIEKVIAISGFASIEILLSTWLKGFAKLGKKAIFNYEKTQNPEYAESCAINKLNTTSSKVLIVHSKDDSTVPYKNNIDVMKNSITNPNVEYMLFDNKKHNPNYTFDAVCYMEKVFKSKEFQNADWVRMTTQDPVFWNRAFEFLNK